MRGMVLAAGFATRMQPLSHVRPKALLPCFSFPLLRLVLHRLNPAVNGSVLVNLHHREAQVVEFLRGEGDIITLAEEQILGTGGGIANAVRCHPGTEPLLVHNVDILSDIDLTIAVDAFQRSSPYAMLLLHYHPDFLQVHQNGDCITGFGKDGSLAYTGIMILSSQAQRELAAADQFSIIEFLQDAITGGQEVTGLEVKPDFWLDCGRASQYLQFHSRYFQDERFSEAVMKVLPEPPHILRNNFIGERVKLDPGIEICDTVIWDDVQVKRGPIKSAVLTDGVIVTQPVHQAMVL
jgi:NDP-sugar pyrophosphorylase family protein